MTSENKALSLHASRQPTILVIIFMGLIIGIAFGSYFYFQNIAENSVRDELFQQYTQKQIGDTKALANRIGSDIDGIILRLELLASKPSLQDGELSSERTTSLAKQANLEINEITLNDGIILLGSDNVVAYSTNYPELVGVDASFRDYVIAARESLKPVVSEGLQGKNGSFGIGIAVPIINNENKNYVGMAAGALAAEEFFNRYGNINDPNSQVIVATDKSGNYLSVIPASRQYLGENVFSDRVQDNLIKRNPDLNKMFNDAIKSSKLAYTTFDVGTGERFGVASPVFAQGEQIMTIVQSIPIATISSQVDDILTATTLRGNILLSAVSAAIIILAFFLIRWNRSLDTSVRQRTAELKESNENLAHSNSALLDSNLQLGKAYEMVLKSNEQLEAHDRMQREFINIAAHELRTPVQPLLGVTEILEASSKGAEKIEITRAELEMIIRNVNRLERLSSEILEASRIESNSLTLHKESIDLVKKTKNIVSDLNNALRNKELNIIVEHTEESVTVQADALRLFEVISNLLSNAIKFTSRGTIIVKVERVGKNAAVTVSDSGIGIDPEIVSQLFTKFVSRSDTGTGLGLYISKNIIEAHGGKIWGHNNPSGKGATFGFILPLHHSKEIQYE